MEISISLFFIVAACCITYLTLIESKKVFLQAKSYKDAQELVTTLDDIGYTFIAYYLLEEGLITKTQSEKIISASDSMYEIDPRLKQIQDAISQKASLKKIDNE